MRKKPKKKLTLPIRINIIFLCVFFLFSMLILQLGFLQIVDGEKYAAKVSETQEVIVEKPVPRGKIYDRNGNLIVGNEPKYAITYTKTESTDPSEMLETAEQLSTLISMDTSKLSEQDKKDYWLVKHPKEAQKMLTEKELAEMDAIQDRDPQKAASETYKLQLKRVPEEELNALTPEEMNTATIFKKFNSGYAMTQQIVKNEGVTVEEMSRVTENLAEMPGVDTTVDWDRTYPYGNTLRSVLGSVSSTQEGIPEEDIDAYLAKGYSRNDRVGKSYLEAQYEDLLRGQKEKVAVTVNKDGNVTNSEVVQPGIPGKDLVLSIDMELQQATDTIISEELTKRKQSGTSPLLDRAFVVLTDPRNGEILTMSGKQYVVDPVTGQAEIQDMALGTFTTSYNMGSAVKGATILTGYATDAIEMGQTFYDAPMYIKGTPPKKSWKNLGMVDDLAALKMSSNVYMFNTAIAIGGGQYVPNGPLDLDPDAFRVMRNHFAEFGLGVKTGIDLPGEQVGFKDKNDPKPGFLLDFSIGQYDTYTTMQMAQYVSTIANGGYRLQPHLLKEVHEPTTETTTLGPLYSEVKPVVLNRVSNTDEEIARVQEGFRQASQAPGGTATPTFKGASYKPAGKTGTAQAFYDGPQRVKGTPPPETENVTYVSYAPYDNPEIAMAVAVPWAYQTKSNHMNLDIAKQVYDTYFELKAKRAQQPLPQNNSPLPTDSEAAESENAVVEEGSTPEIDETEVTSN